MAGPAARQSVWITNITLFEARLGLALLPSGRRRQTLEAAFGRLLIEDLENRVLDFDSASAIEAALLAAARQKNGRAVDMRDTQIAGIVIARRATLATRGTSIGLIRSAATSDCQSVRVRCASARHIKSSGTSNGPACVGIAKTKTAKQKIALRMICFMSVSFVWGRPAGQPSMINTLVAGGQVRCDAHHKNDNSPTRWPPPRLRRLA